MSRHTCPSDHRAAKWILLLFGVLLAYIISEGCCRLFLKAPASVSIENLRPTEEGPFLSHRSFTVEDGKIISPGLPDWGLYVYTPTGIRLKKNVQAIIRNHNISQKDIPFSTNDLGFRHPQLAEKRQNDLRILVLGDSITLGDYVLSPETYPAQIETFLDELRPERLKEKKIDVINAAVGSIDLQNAFAILMETGLQVKPDIVVVGLYLNDAYLSPSIKITQLPALLRKSHFLRILFHKIYRIRTNTMLKNWEQQRPVSFDKEKSVFLNTHPTAETEDQDTVSGFNRIIANNFQDWGYAWGDGYGEKISRLLSMMRTVSEEENFRLVVVFFPVRQQIQSRILHNEPQQRMAVEMARLNLPYLDLLPALRQQYLTDSQDLLYDHCHYRPAGNKLIGQIIAHFLIKDILEE